MKKKEDKGINFGGHRAVHKGNHQATIYQTPRVANIQAGASRSSIGAYPDAADAILLVDGAADGFNTSFRVPDDWVIGTPIYTIIYYSMQDASGGNVRLRYNYLEYTGTQAAGDSGTQTDVTITPASSTSVRNTRRQLFTPRGKNLVRFNFGRLGGDGADTYAATMRIFGWAFEYTAHNTVV